MSSNADRNMLLGILALQNGFIDRDELVAAMNDWVLDKRSSLSAILRRRGALEDDVLVLLETLVDKQIARHAAGDNSIATLASFAPARKALAQIPDADIQESLASLGPLDQVADADLASTASATDRSGRYTIVRLHAAGALGEVFVAKDNELGREVALKQIQEQHLNNEHLRLRFQREAEITGGLEHPGIVPVYSLGRYSDGRPFYAMRFIRGDSLKDAVTKFHEFGPPNGGGSMAARFETLEFRNLLRRLIDACNAIAFAHSRGVLHRDLKPANIMVGRFGETLVVDWGLAKAVGVADAPGASTVLIPSAGVGSETDLDLTTAGSVVGTPAYMSPEQAEGRLVDLGPATDVYSLGATLYTILTGKLAFSGSAPYQVIADVSEGRFERPTALQESTPPPLEAICLKAMARSPTDRYGSASDMAKELERYLADEPVLAAPEPASLRARRWLRRHSGAALSFATALAVGLVGLTAGLLIVGGKNRELADQKRDLAAANDGLLAANIDLKRAQEESSRRQSRLLKSYSVLAGVFHDLNPNGENFSGKPIVAALADRLTAAAAQMDDGMGDAVDLARLRLPLGVALRGLGQLAPAFEALSQSYRVMDERLGHAHGETIDCRRNLALAAKDLGKLAQAEQLARANIAEQARLFGTSARETLRGEHNLGGVLVEKTEFAAAEQLLQRALNEQVKQFGAADSDVLTTLQTLGTCQQRSGRYADAEASFSLLLERAKGNKTASSIQTLTVANALAVLNAQRGRYDRAKELYEENLAAFTKLLGPENLHVLKTKLNLAALYNRKHDNAAAVVLFEDILPRLEIAVGANHADTLACMQNLATCCQQLGRFDRAESLFKKSLAILDASYPPDHLTVLIAAQNLAVFHRDRRQYALAIPLFERAIGGAQRTLGPENPQTLRFLRNYVICLDRKDPLDPTEAKRCEALVRGFVDYWKKHKGADSLETAGQWMVLGKTLLRFKKLSEAEAATRSALAIFDLKQPAGLQRMLARSLLGEILAAQGKDADAEALLLEGQRGIGVIEAPATAAIQVHEANMLAIGRLVAFYRARGKSAEAELWQKALQSGPPKRMPTKK